MRRVLAQRVPTPLGEKMDIETFLTEMAANSEKLPQLPDEAFTRESFYQDHDWWRLHGDIWLTPTFFCVFYSIMTPCTFWSDRP